MMMKLRTLFKVPRRLVRQQKGVTIVEFGFVGPVLILMVMGVLDVGHQLYARSVLAGQMQKAGRDSALETGTTNGTTLDNSVKTAVLKIASNATVTFKRKSYRTFSDASAAQAEDFTDTDGNGTCNGGEPYEDANNNSNWDADGGNSGQGGAKDVVVYTATVTYPRLFPMAGLIGLPSTVTLTSSTVLPNQPFSDQDLSAATARNCT